MSRISKDSSSDVSNLSTLSVLPRRSIVNLTPSQGAIVYDLSSNSLAVSDGTTWSQVGSGGSGGPPSGPAGGDLSGSYPNPTLDVIGTTVGPIGTGTTVPVITKDDKGRVTSLTSTAISFPPSTSQVSGTPIGPFPGLTTGDVLTWNGVTWVNSPAGGGGAPSGPAGGDLAGTYPNPTLAVIGTATGPIGNGTTVPVVTIDSKGRVTSLTSTPITGGGGSSILARLRRQPVFNNGIIPSESAIPFTTVNNQGFAVPTPQVVTIPFTGLLHYHAVFFISIANGLLGILPKSLWFKRTTDGFITSPNIYTTPRQNPNAFEGTAWVVQMTAMIPVTAGETWHLCLIDESSSPSCGFANESASPNASQEFWTIYADN